MDHNLCFGCMEERDEDRTCPRCGYTDGAAPESLLHLPLGTILQGKYLIGRVLGQGGFGITYLAWDKTLKIKLAIKEYLPQQLAIRSAGQNTVTFYKSSLAEEFRYGLNKFLEEARTLARFNEHPNIVTVRDYFEANNTAYLVMNYHQGVTLLSYLESKGGKIPVEQALKIFMPVLDALKEVHAAGILHRDISPDNLLLNTEGRVILIDFGAARQAVGEKSESLSMIMKAGYSPEEQYRSKGKQGPWTDIYALAATFYRAITGQAPLESIERMVEDDLAPPSQLGAAIEPGVEKVMLKAMAVKAADRYPVVEEFQTSLLASGQDLKVMGTAAASEAIIPSSIYTGKQVSQKEPSKVNETEPASQKVAGAESSNLSVTSSKEVIKYAAFLIGCGLLIFGAISLFGGGFAPGNMAQPGMQETEQKIADNAEEVNVQAEAGEPEQTFSPAVIAALDADYYIDYANGTIPIGDLPIGTWVVDPSWEWEFRTGSDYSGSGIVKPVTWIIVATNHYDGLEPHVTLLAEELIARYPFDNSTGRGHEDDEYGYNHWGDSGTGNATRGLRPWLNSGGIHAGEGFLRAFSASFVQAVLTTYVPNKKWEDGSVYITRNKVFLPSSTELGDGEHFWTDQIGSAYPYFQGAGGALRVAGIGGERQWYWTRSPALFNASGVLNVNYIGEFEFSFANYDITGVRPALNLKADILVTEIRD